jgi:hypothetical protein
VPAGTDDVDITRTRIAAMRMLLRFETGKAFCSPRERILWWLTVDHLLDLIRIAEDIIDTGQSEIRVILRRV